jgi:hypothetical protein
MKRIHPFQLIFLSLLWLTSCAPDPPAEPGKYDLGIFIINGGESDADGSISFMLRKTQAIENDIFETVNGRAIGGRIQSMKIEGDYAYIIVNNPDKIEVVERVTFKSVATITGQSNPRYFAARNGKGYVTNWGPKEGDDYPHSFVSVFDLATNKIITTIDMEPRPEHLLSREFNVVVSSNGGNNLCYIEGTDLLQSKLKIYYAPRGLETDVNGFMVVLTDTSGIFVINDLAHHISSLRLHGFHTDGELYTNGSGTEAYFSTTEPSGDEILTKIHQYYPGSNLNPDFIQRKNVYGFGVDKLAENYWLGTKDDNGNDIIERYNNDGQLFATYTAGKRPRAFVFVTP